MRAGNIDEPVAEQTKTGLVIMSLGLQNDLISALFTKASGSEYERLCDIEVLGIEENHLSLARHLSLAKSYGQHVYKKLKQQLRYDKVIRHQFANKNIVKISESEKSKPKELFLPHRGVIQRMLSQKIKRSLWCFGQVWIWVFSQWFSWKRRHHFKINSWIF